MKITVKLFASLGSFAPHGESARPFACQVPPGTRIQDLLDRLDIPEGEARLLFVNGRTRRREDALQPGDEVGIFPPVGGG